MKIGMIVELLKQPLNDGIATAAELGAQGIQLYAINHDHNLLEFDRGQLRDLKSRCDGHGLEISAICGDLRGHGFRIAADNPKKIVMEKQIIDLAVNLDCHVITTHIGAIPSDPRQEAYENLRSAMAELGEHAAARNAVIAIETGPEPAPVLKQFIQDAGGKGIGVNLDPANLVMVLNADPAEAVELLGKHIVHTHAKDGIHYRQCDPERVYNAFAEGGFAQLVAETGKLFAEMPLGQGQVPWERYLAALKQTGFNGFLTIEREVGDNPRADIALAIKFLQQKLNQLN